MNGPGLDLATLARRGIRTGRALAGSPARRSPPRWCLAEVRGRLVEVSGTGAGAWLSLASLLVAEVQSRGEPAAWVTVRGSVVHPPDLARQGIDLSALPVVFSPTAPAAARAAERLVRSGGFGLVVLDLVGAPPTLPPALSSRLAALANRHGATVLVLVEKDPGAPSLGTRVSLRCEGRREGGVDGIFSCRVAALRDRLRGGSWSAAWTCHGPPGLC